jgi:hypothetical protein
VVEIRLAAGVKPLPGQAGDARYPVLDFELYIRQAGDGFLGGEQGGR